MDTLAKLIICVVLGAFYAPSHSATYTPDFGELKLVDGDLHITRGNGTTSLIYPDAGISKEIPVNTSKGNFPVPVQKSFPVVPAKVGKAATRFLKTLPAIGTAIAIYDTVCDLADICKNQDTGDLQYVERRVLAEGHPDVASPHWYQVNGRPETSSHDPQYSCDILGTLGPTLQGYAPFTYTSVPSNRCVSTSWTELMSTYSGCLNGYTRVGDQCVITQPGTKRPVTESDWTAAETKLNAQPQQVAESLYNSDAPVPVDASTQSSPVIKQISQTSTQTKDAQGNVTGTQVATTSVKVEDTSTASNVTYNVTETTTITNYNESNEITSTQTSTADTEQPSVAEDTDISFDNVSDVQLDTEEIDVQLETPVSWGEGTCPPDETLTLQGRSYAISYEPACEVAADLRPIFVLLASVTALFIVAGVSRSRGD